MFTQTDIRQIETRGATPAQIETQIETKVWKTSRPGIKPFSI